MVLYYASNRVSRSSSLRRQQGDDEIEITEEKEIAGKTKFATRLDRQEKHSKEKGRHEGSREHTKKRFVEQRAAAEPKTDKKLPVPEKLKSKKVHDEKITMEAMFHEYDEGGPHP